MLESKKLNILFLCSWYPNPENASNGIFIKRHAQALAKKHHVTVLFVKSVKHTEEIIYANVDDDNFTERCVFYPKVGLNIPVLGSFLKLRKFKEEYEDLIDDLPKETKFDIIHLNVIFPAAIPASYALKKYPNAQLFITEHWSGYYPEDGNYKGFYLKDVTRKIVAKAKAIFVISDKLKNAMLSNGLEGNFEVINNVVDTSVFKPMDNLKTDNDTLKILHVSSLVNREKNISGIISVAEKLLKKNIKFQLTVVGKNDGEIIEHKNSVHQKRLNNHVTFVGYKTPEEIAVLMNQSDVFILLSHFEGMPVVLLEAISCGLPVITTHVGQVKSMVPAAMGVVLNSDPVNEAVGHLSNFSSLKFLDKKKMHQYIVENYSMVTVCDSLIKLYQKYSGNA